MTTRILALTDALGNLVDFRLMPGQAHDLRETRELLEDVCCGMLLADKAFDAEWLRELLEKRKIEAVIPPRSNRRSPHTMTNMLISGDILLKTSSRKSRNSNA